MARLLQDVLVTSKCHRRGLLMRAYMSNVPEPDEPPFFDPEPKPFEDPTPPDFTDPVPPPFEDPPVEPFTDPKPPNFNDPPAED